MNLLAPNRIHPIAIIVAQGVRRNVVVTTG
jgi:hypothetical protein